MSTKFRPFHKSVTSLSIFKHYGIKSRE